jgi:DNA-binding beta-propeller fold protein YncE
MASDAAGNLFIVTDDCVYKIDPTGTFNRVAGNSRVGFSGDGGPAGGAQFNNPGGIAVDNSGNLYIADSGNNRIRKVTLGNNVITTIAGLSSPGYSGDNQPSTSAALNNPQGLALDSAGNLYIADSGNHAIRKITNGTITTIAGTGFPGNGIDNQLATSTQLNSPMGVAVDSLLNVYVSDSNNHKIRKIQAGIMSTIAGTGVPGFSGEGGLATGAQLNVPKAIALDSSNQVYLIDYNNVRVRKIVPNGVITTVAGGTGGALKVPSGIAVDTANNLYIADSSLSQILQFSPAGTAVNFAGGGPPFALGDGQQAVNVQLVQPQGLAVDSALSVYIADRGELRIRKVSGGTISSPAGATAKGPSDVALDSAGIMYIADAVGNQILRVVNGGFTVIAGSGAQGFADNTTGNLAQFNQPNAVVVDPAGTTVYVADTGNNRIRKVVLATGLVTTIAGNGNAGFGGDNGISNNAVVNQPTGLALDNAGNLYIADTGNNRIRVINAAGVITTAAGNGANGFSGDGGQATAAAISSPHGVAIDTLGNLYIPDYTGRVRKVAVSGVITTIAGNGTPGYSGDPGPALSAQLNTPWDVAVDANGTVYVSDVGAQAVRVLTPVAAPPLSITSTSQLPGGIVGTPYAATLTATGGSPPYAWSTSSFLPPGLTLTPSGSITGTPTVASTFIIGVQVTDTASVKATAQVTITIAPAAPGGLNITTPPVLVPGIVGTAYSQNLTATGGSAPYTWTLVAGALPAGLTLFTNGLISGTPATAGPSNFSIRVTDAAGNIANQPSFSLSVLAQGSLSRTGVLAHFAVGSTWTTKVYVTNISSTALAVNLVFHWDDGNPFPLPLTVGVTQQGSSQQINTNSFTGAMNPNTTLVLDVSAPIGNILGGWIDVLSSGAPNSLAGFAVFRTAANGIQAEEGTSPLQTTFESKMDLQFDNTGGFVTAVALVNLSPSPASITATVLDVSGVQIGTYSVQLQGNGHSSFVFTDPSGFPVTANKQGIVQFLNTSGGAVAGVGLRASTTTGTFTSVPVILP